MIKIMLIAGARPNFMKIASIIDAIETHNRSARPEIRHFLVHTGQHYDERMSHAFFRDLALPPPDVDLEVGSSSHAAQTAEIMKRFEPVLLEQRPDVVLVVGDVNSTIACSLVASKITYPRDRTKGPERPLIAHVESGLRSFDRSMPEEINRILTDALSDFLFITEEGAAENLRKEGISKEKIYVVGNTMVDTLLKHRQRAEASKILSRLGLENPPSEGQKKRARDYAILTLHRPSNVDEPESFHEILEAVSVISKEVPVLFPVHPRTMGRIREFGFEKYFAFGSEDATPEIKASFITCIEPLGYLDFLCLTSNARLILTDSGGIQEETTVLGVPCVTLRENTERPVTLTHGTNVLAGTKKEAIVRHAVSKLRQPTEPKTPKFWDGQAGTRIIKILTQRVPVPDQS